MKSCPHDLAIGNDWKLHDENTDMASHAWVLHEEAAFLGEPALCLRRKLRRAVDHLRSGLGSIVSAPIAGSTAPATLSS
jgi:hypothetical protein